MSKFLFIQMKWCRNVFSFEWNDVETYFHFIRMKWEYFRTTFIPVEARVFSVTPDPTRLIPRRRCYDQKNFCDALKRLISTNIISVKILGWIEQKKSSNQIDIKNDKNSAFSINYHISKIEVKIRAKIKIEIKIEIKVETKNQNRFFTYFEFLINWGFCVQN